MLLFLCLVNKPCLVAVFLFERIKQEKENILRSAFLITRVLDRQEQREREISNDLTVREAKRGVPFIPRTIKVWVADGLEPNRSF